MGNIRWTEQWERRQAAQVSETLSSLTAPSWFAHPGARTWTCLPAPADVQGFHAALPGYTPTPLTELPSLADELNVGRVFVKDESCRLGLPAFKALGASWAVHRTLAERAGTQEADSQEADGQVTLVTATDGNHGRAVARMARMLGQRAHVFVPHGVHPAAAAAIAAEEARVTEVAGNYDEAVRRAAAAVDATPGAVLIQDTAWPGYERIPGWIVEGYATLFAEIDAQLAAVEAGSPDLVAIPVGVGSLAQAAVTHYRSGGDSAAPAALLSVEPDSAAGVLTSLTRQAPVTVTTGETTMAGLNCGTPPPSPGPTSATAWTPPSPSPTPTVHAPPTTSPPSASPPAMRRRLARRRPRRSHRRRRPHPPRRPVPRPRLNPRPAQHRGHRRQPAPPREPVMTAPL